MHEGANVTYWQEQTHSIYCICTFDLVPSHDNFSTVVRLGVFLRAISDAVGAGGDDARVCSDVDGCRPHDIFYLH